MGQSINRPASIAVLKKRLTELCERHNNEQNYVKKMWVSQQIAECENLIDMLSQNTIEDAVVEKSAEVWCVDLEYHNQDIPCPKCELPSESEVEAQDILQSILVAINETGCYLPPQFEDQIQRARTYMLGVDGEDYLPDVDKSVDPVDEAAAQRENELFQAGKELNWRVK